MKIEVLKSSNEKAIRSGEICPVDPKKKHWMCKIIGLDAKFGFNRDFLTRALYEKGKPGGYSIDKLKEGDIVEEADVAKNKEYARITKIEDTSLEFEFMRASEVTEHFQKPGTKTAKSH